MFFKKKKNYENILLSLSIATTLPPVGSSSISDNIKISGKYYKFTPCCFDDVFKINSNIALYIRVKYVGLYQMDFCNMIDQYYSKLLKRDEEVYDVSHLEYYEFYKINFTELFNQTKEYHIETDVKDAMPDTKHILHFHDNENAIEGFFVYYDSDFVDKEYQKWFEDYIKSSFTSKCKGYRGTLCH